MGLLDNILKIFVGDKSKQDVGAIKPIVEQIKSHEKALEALSIDGLREKTNEFKQRIAADLKEVNDKRTELQTKAEQEEDIDKREDIYTAIDKLKDEAYSVSEKTLAAILPEAFAVVKETAKRFVHNTQLEVTATEYDRFLSGSKDYVTLDGDKAIWANSWDAAGKEVTWDMIHYDCLLYTSPSPRDRG